jgi:hypothetical protein
MIVKSVVIESGVTSIGAYCFQGCTEMSSVTIPGTVAAIGSSAFIDCLQLKTISNNYNGFQTIGLNVLTGAGSGVTAKTAYCFDPNAGFISAAEAAGYIVAVFDTVPPQATHALSPDDYTGLSVTITINTIDNCAMGTIFLPDGTEVSGSTAEYAVTENDTYSFTIRDAAGNQLVYPVTISNICRTISVTHSIDSAYLIDPNDINPFIASDIELVNNARIPVSVSVLSLSAATGGLLTLNDVAPTAFPDWNELTRVETLTNIAVSVGVKETAPVPGGWLSIAQYTPLYAAQIHAKIQLGVLEANGGSGHLSLVVLCGLAWDAAYTASHNLVLIFDAN